MAVFSINRQSNEGDEGGFALGPAGERIDLLSRLNAANRTCVIALLFVIGGAGRTSV